MWRVMGKEKGTEEYQTWRVGRAGRLLFQITKTGHTEEEVEKEMGGLILWYNMYDQTPGSDMVEERQRNKRKSIFFSINHVPFGSGRPELGVWQVLQPPEPPRGDWTNSQVGQLSLVSKWMFYLDLPVSLVCRTSAGGLGGYGANMGLQTTTVGLGCHKIHGWWTKRYGWMRNDEWWMMSDNTRVGHCLVICPCHPLFPTQRWSGPHRTEV